jgi:ElaB/YqjD/DUF883 family membrane-anchored ribosome-binding protein
MADPLRNDYKDPLSPLEEPAVSDQSIAEVLAGFTPTRTSRGAYNPQLNRTAESIGTALGTAVGRMRSGLSLVHDREQELQRDMTETLSEKAETLSAAATEKAEALGDIVEEKASQLYTAAQEQWEFISEKTRDQVVEWRRQAAQLRDEHPLELIAAFAGAAFVLGAALKVWRSIDD